MRGENSMALESELFDISRKTWQSFSSEQIIRVESDFDSIQTLSLQWFYCNLSGHRLVILGVDSIAGYRLAAEMLNEPVGSLSSEDEEDAVEELVNCICGQLDRDHPANESFGLPQLLISENISSMLSDLGKLCEVTAKVGGMWFYIALFKAKGNDSYGGVK